MGGTPVEVLEVSRNTAVALASRDRISQKQFEVLYGAFVRAIPIGSLKAALELD